MLVEFGRSGWLAKARSQPDKVRQVFDKIRTDGLLPTLDAVRSKLDQALPMGYSNIGIVEDAGSSNAQFKRGDRVVSNGHHAETVSVPSTLCARIPDGVTDDSAVFTVLGSIALEGVRLAQPTLGECVVVSGLGIIGLLTTQILVANGCRVLGLDFSPQRCGMARSYGAETVQLGEGVDPVAAGMAFSRDRGVDAVLICASTPSNDPVHHAAQMCRKRGRIVLVGVTGLQLSRDDFYKKELSFQVSCSYGPGRYDPSYEEQGHDYPIGFVRWTAQRNFEAVLDLMASGRLKTDGLISHRFPIDRAPEAYDLLVAGTASLGIAIDYPMTPEREAESRTVQVTPTRSYSAGAVVVGMIGAGNYGSRVLLPALRDAGAALKTVTSSGGINALQAARTFGFEQASTDSEVIFTDKAISTIVVATRHDTHASLVCRALRAGKHVFVEKPLAITREQLAEIVAAEAACSQAGQPGPMVMVGFNRRFAPHVRRIKSLMSATTGPKSMIMTVNAGAIPRDHWTRDRAIGGGRIIGEGCHFIDLLRFLAGSPIVSVGALPIGGGGADEALISLGFADGSVGSITYVASGHRSFPKERLEVFASGRTLQLDNFRKLRGFGWPGLSTMNLWRQDKGNAACVAAFVEAARDGKPAPIPFPELIEVAEATFTAVEALEGRT